MDERLEEDLLACRDRDDIPPSGEEARRQSAETAMPLLWGLLGLLAVAGYALFLGVF